jgi:ABC-type sugar transport system substrate-binding protein
MKPSKRSTQAFAFFAVLVAMVVALAHGTADAEKERGHIPRIGVITPGDVDSYEQAFMQGLAENGFKRGETIEIEINNANGNLETGAKKAEELVALDLDAI